LVAIDASLPALATGTAQATTTASFSPPANTLLVAYFAANNPSPGADCSLSGVTSSPSLTWTRRARKSTNAASDGGAGTAGAADIWTAPYAAGGAITVTATSVDATTGAGHEKALQVVPYTGADTTALTNIITATSTSGLPSATLPGCSAGSLAGAISSDWAQAGLGTAGTGQTIVSESNIAGQMTMHIWRTTTTLASSGSQTMNLTAPAAEQYNMCAIEIKDSGGGGGPTGGGSGPANQGLQPPMFQQGIGIMGMLPIPEPMRSWLWWQQDYGAAPAGVTVDSGALSFDQTSTFDVIAVVQEVVPATFDQTSTFGVAPDVQRVAPVAFAQTSTLDVVGIQQIPSVAAFAQTSTLALINTALASVTFTQTSTLSATALLNVVSPVTFASTSTLAATALLNVISSVTFASTSTLAATGRLDIPAAVTFASTSTLAATVRLTIPATATFASTSTLSAIATTPGSGAVVTFTSTSTLSATGRLDIPVVITFVGTSTLAATATLKIPAVVTFANTSSFAAVVSLTIPAATAFVSTSTLSVTPQVIRTAPVTFTGTNTLSATAQVTRVAPVTFTGTNSLVTNAIKVIPGLATFVGTSTLDVIAAVVPSQPIPIIVGNITVSSVDRYSVGAATIAASISGVALLDAVVSGVANVSRGMTCDLTGYGLSVAISTLHDPGSPSVKPGVTIGV
jgi:hypothetical protein